MAADEPGGLEVVPVRALFPVLLVLSLSVPLAAAAPVECATSATTTLPEPRWPYECDTGAGTTITITNEGRDRLRVVASHDAGDLDGDGKGDGASCGVQRNITVGSGDPDFDLLCGAGPADPIGASCASVSGAATPTCVAKWRVFAPLPGGFATTSRGSEGDTSAGVVVFAGGAAAGCLASVPAPGRGQPAFFCFP